MLMYCSNMRGIYAIGMAKSSESREWIHIIKTSIHANFIWLLPQPNSKVTVVKDIQMEQKIVRKLCFILLLLSLSMTAEPARGQLKPLTLYLGGGITNPTSDKLDNGWKRGVHAAAALGIRLGSHSELMLRAGVHSLGADKTFYSIAEGGRFTAVVYGAGLKYNFGLPLVPFKAFLLGGAGAAVLNVSDVFPPTPQVPLTARRNRPYFSVGAGLSIGPYWGQIRVITSKADGDTFTFVPLTVGIKL